MHARRIALAIVVATLGIAVGAPSANAVIGNAKVNKITFSAPVRLPGVVLLPGQYTFESGPLGTDPAIVRVTDSKNRRMFYQGFTRSSYRPKAMDASKTVLFGEVPIGAPQPIAQWYPLGSQVGHTFIYR